MPSETFQAIVLRHANYRDHDRMLTLLSPEKGRVDVLSRGCRKPKSALMPASELFVLGEFVTFRTIERHTLSACAISDTFYSLRLDAYRLTCATYLLNLAQAAAQPEQPAQGLFSLLLKGLYHLTYAADEPPLAILNTFLLLYADEIGYKPRLNHCVRCRQPIDASKSAVMDIEAGGLCCCAAKGAYVVSPAQIVRMRETLKTGFDGAQTENDAALFQVLRRYVECRLEMSIPASKFLP